TAAGRATGLVRGRGLPRGSPPIPVTRRRKVMQTLFQRSQRFQTPCRPVWLGPALWLAALMLCASGSGCAALSNPVANGVPVRRLSPELLGESKANLELIPLTSLRQTPPDAYRLGPEDVLGIWIEGVIGEKGQPPPITTSLQPNQPPGLGYPVP